MIDAKTLRELISYDPKSGSFSRIIKNTNAKTGWLDKIGYRWIMVDSKTYSAHRLAWFYITGEWPKGEIDHMNGIKDDNRFCNLRDVNRYTNMQNEQKARITNKSGYLGVHFRKERNKWVAQLRINGKSKRFGSFDTPEEAYEAYLKAKRLNHEGCTI